MARTLGEAVPSLRRTAPIASTSLRVATYAPNELTYNPPSDVEGMLFWFPWWFHTTMGRCSAHRTVHGSAARAKVLVNCQQLTGNVPSATSSRPCSARTPCARAVPG